MPTVGADAYAEDVTTRVLCLAYKFDDQPIRVWVPGEPIPHAFYYSMTGGIEPVTHIAHNASFEIAIWHNLLEPLGWPKVPPLTQWSCTMARAQYHGLPAALDDVAVALRFPPHQRKDAAGRRIMLQLMRPRSISPLRWWHDDDAAKFAALQAYCVRDVEIESKLDRILPELPATEAELWRINQAMNTEGVLLDVDLIERMKTIVAAETRRLNRELIAITQGEVRSVNQVATIRKFLLDKFQLKLDVLDKDTVAHVLVTQELCPTAERILTIRAEAAKTSTAKLTAMKRAVSDDRQARGLFRYYGASRTGRYSSQRVQLQNMARPTIRDPEVAIDLIRRRATGDTLRLLWDDSPLGVISSCLRGCIVAHEGCLLPIADLAQIEARVIAWLAGQSDILKVFADPKQDVYTYTARNVGSDNRQLGKVMVLALGFGMGASRFRDTAAKYGVTIDAARAEALVDAWRAANQEIVQFWWDLHSAAMRIAGGQFIQSVVGRIILYRRKKAMVMRLPSGRELFYQYIDREMVDTEYGQRLTLTYEGVNQYTRRWERLRAWAGRLAENATQAVARDILTDSLRSLNATGVKIIGTVHDELIAEEREALANTCLAQMLSVMRRAPSWAPGLPVWAEGRVAARYGK